MYRLTRACRVIGRHSRALATGPPAKKNVTQLAKEISLKGEVVLVRSDLNVPMTKEGPPTITDDTRIVEALPTIKLLLAEGARVVVTSHMGRPKKAKTDASLRRPCQARGRRYKESLGKQWGQHWPEEALQPAPPTEVVELGGKSFPIAGPDMMALVIGSEGTFGIVTKITCRLTPNHEKAITLLGVFDSVHKACEGVSAIVRRGIIPAAMVCPR